MHQHDEDCDDPQQCEAFKDNVKQALNALTKIVEFTAKNGDIDDERKLLINKIMASALLGPILISGREATSEVLSDLLLLRVSYERYMYQQHGVDLSGSGSGNEEDQEEEDFVEDSDFTD